MNCVYIMYVMTVTMILTTSYDFNHTFIYIYIKRSIMMLTHIYFI
ncbi:unnamed protein product [Arabidopsis halleri]